MFHREQILMEVPHRYIHVTSPSPALIVATITQRGWKTRSTRRDAYNHDYVSDESMDALLRWISTDGSKFDVNEDREEALERLTSPDGSSVVPWCFLQPQETPAAGAVEQVLQHLERGW